jgi:alkanesulfonate monooxygenase SsuD/methylene tetrahydromethanopterin reductase-like flavin-dependent oxidoreductase (luciferase family)
MRKNKRGFDMKVGVINGIRNHPDRPYSLQQVYADFIDDAVYAEKLGFDFAWYGEHHFTRCQWTPSPLVVCAAVAAKTQRLRIGTSLVCLPFHNPLRVAEDVAVVDIISGGRFDFGIGVGSNWEEYHTFGIPSAERSGRTWEAAEIIERCFTHQGTFSHKGKYYEFADIAFTTKPVQNKVPFWWGGWGPKNVVRAAERGYHLLSGGSQAYDEALRQAGRNPQDFFIAPMQQVCVAETEEKAWEASLDGLHYSINFYILRKRLDGSIPPPSAEITREMLRSGDLVRKRQVTTPDQLREPEAPAQLIDDTTPHVGTPDQLRERFKAIRAGSIGRVTHLPLGFRHAGMKTSDVHRSMELFAKEVLPLLK